METVVLSLGGSLIVPSKIDVTFLRKFRKLVLKEHRFRFAIICGGGKVCREYQSSAQQISKISSNDLDLVGIVSTRLNAELIRAGFGKAAYERVLMSPNEKISTKKRVIVGGGELPGWSTDMDAVLLAKNLKAKVVINLSNVPYVYDKDPNKHKGAKPFSRLTWKEYLQVIAKRWIPGLNTPFDPVAARKAQKYRITVVIMRGSDLNNLKNYLEGRKFKGTIIE